MTKQVLIVDDDLNVLAVSVPGPGSATLHERPEHT
jgi:hypothetical protein